MGEKPEAIKEARTKLALASDAVMAAQKPSKVMRLILFKVAWMGANYHALLKTLKDQGIVDSHGFIENLVASCNGQADSMLNSVGVKQTKSGLIVPDRG